MLALLLRFCVPFIIYSFFFFFLRTERSPLYFNHLQQRQASSAHTVIWKMKFKVYVKVLWYGTWKMLNVFRQLFPNLQRSKSFNNNDLPFDFWYFHPSGKSILRWNINLKNPVYGNTGGMEYSKVEIGGIPGIFSLSFILFDLFVSIPRSMKIANE